MTDYKLEKHRGKSVFSDIEVGEMFVDDMENIFVKTFDTTLKGGGEFNAVRITKTPYCYYFQGSESVARIKKAVFTV